jgi:hypothetical protein
MNTAYTTAAIYRMLKRKKINKDTAVELMLTRSDANRRTAKATVELWLNGPLSTH